MKVCVCVFIVLFCLFLTHLICSPNTSTHFHHLCFHGFSMTFETLVNSTSTDGTRNVHTPHLRNCEKYKKFRPPYNCKTGLLDPQSPPSIWNSVCTENWTPTVTGYCSFSQTTSGPQALFAQVFRFLLGIPKLSQNSSVTVVTSSRCRDSCLYVPQAQ